MQAETIRFRVLLGFFNSTFATMPRWTYFKTPLSISVALNVLLFVVLLSLAVFCVYREVVCRYRMDSRPRGEPLALPRALPVYREGTSEQVFILPAGTVLQESTPQGLANFWQVKNREFLLIIKSDLDFSATTYTETVRWWVPTPYHFKTENPAQTTP